MRCTTRVHGGAEALEFASARFAVLTMHKSRASYAVLRALLQLALFQVVSSALVSIFCLSLPANAWAATWPLPVSGHSASVAFHETYSAGDNRFVHSGIDVPASAGTQISCPLAGKVRFTGAVPSGDSRAGGAAAGEKTMHAVSVQIADGRVITLMPFDEVCVSSGQEVAEGQLLGTLSGDGDASSEGSHLHMGLKRGSVYYDPMELFGIVDADDTAPQGSEAQSSAAAIDAPSRSATSGLQVVPAACPQVFPQQSCDAPAEPGLALDLAAQADAAKASQSKANAKESAGEKFGHIASGERARICLHQADRQQHPAQVVLSGALGMCRAQAHDFFSALRAVVQDAGVPVAALVFFGVALVLSAVVSGMVFAAHATSVARRVFMKGSQKQRLSAGGGDGSMHKLFPAPGAAFMSRGR